MAENETPRTVGEIMTRDVKTVGVDATLQEVAVLLHTYSISGAPVVDEGGRVVGVISESDLLNQGKKDVALPRTAVFGLFLPADDTLRHAYHEGADLPASRVMSRHVESATEDTPLTEAASRMLRRGVNRLPVLKADDTLAGIVSREDILRALYHLDSPASSGV
jgi:CBS domain-containing protein